MHLTARPEALAGTLHHLLSGDIGGNDDGPALHESLTGNWELLDRVAAANRRQNRRRGDGGSEETYLLSQVMVAFARRGRYFFVIPRFLSRDVLNVWRIVSSVELVPNLARKMIHQG